MKSIVVIGGSRGVGLEVVREGLAAGINVRALARSAHQIPIDHPQLEKISASALDSAAVCSAIKNVDAVISVLGVPPGFEETRIFSQSAKVLVGAMEQSGVKRLIAVTGIGVGNSNGVGGKLFTGLFQPVFLQKIHEDKNREEEIIMASSLDWTIVRPGFLTRWRKTGKYQALVDPRDWRGGFITRGDVASFLMDIAQKDVFVGQTPLLIS